MAISTQDFIVRIGIDIRWIRTQEMDGISRYVINLIKHLVEVDSKNVYFLITNPIEEGERILPFAFRLSPSLKERVSFVAAPYPLLSYQDFYQLPIFLNQLEIDLFHAPNYLTSPRTGYYAKIITVHDLIPFIYPETLWGASLKWKLYYKSRYPTYLMLQKADYLIADSICTKKDIMNLFGIPSEKITVVWPGVETRFQIIPDTKEGSLSPTATDFSTIQKSFETFRQKYHLPEDFLLYLGRQDPYKGLELLIQAYHQLDDTLQEQYPLVIGGKKNPRYLKLIEHLIDRLSLKKQVQFLDYIPDEDLPSLYKSATLFIFPSLYEGFGFPPLEAMASGTPVIYSRGSSLEEVIGENGHSFTPNSIPELAQAIQMLLRDKQLRAKIAKKGQQYAATFNWQKTAKAVLEVYEKVGR